MKLFVTIYNLKKKKPISMHSRERGGGGGGGKMVEEKILTGFVTKWGISIFEDFF